MSLLDQAHYRTLRVQSPESFKTAAAYRNILGCDATKVVHIAFRSTANIRVMRGARNVCCFGWEFDTLKDHGLSTDSILADQAHMLRLADEVWVGCEFSRQVLNNHGIPHVHVVPAPVVGNTLPERLDRSETLARLADVPVVPLLYVGAATRAENAAMVRIEALADAIGSGEADGAGRIFLTKLSPDDRRKNLLGIIQGFQLAAGEEDHLIVKLDVANRGAFRLHGLNDNLGPLCHGQMAIDDPRILVMLDDLTEAQGDALNCMADFYLSASHCESVNLSLLQSMAWGTVPIATRNTAMLDYLDEDNAVIIAERRLISPVEGLAGDVAGRAYAVGFASRFDVARAIAVAPDIRGARYAALADAARRTVIERHGSERVLAVIEARLAAHPAATSAVA